MPIEDFPVIYRAAQDRVFRAEAELARAEKWLREVDEAWGECIHRQVKTGQ
jgi:hypothetical protein